MRTFLFNFAFICVFAWGSCASAQQASLVLSNCDADYCYSHDNSWTLSKTVDSVVAQEGFSTVTWNVTATKNTTAANTFVVHGGLTVLNSGAASATIGNIVVNLQRRQGNKWVSWAADVANATAGNAATSAKIASAASQEANNVYNYQKSGTGGVVGNFSETSRSGALEFTDATSNTVFSLVPQPTIGAGASVTLLFSAEFNAADLPPPGSDLRVEAIVTFGNAGARGGGGATTINVDINGNGIIDADEANIRSVPCRTGLGVMPAAPEQCNDLVVVNDPGVSTTGTVEASNETGFDVFPEAIEQSTAWTVSADVTAGENGGQVCNFADLVGLGCGGTLNVVIGFDPETNAPIYATFVCAEAAFEEAGSCVALQTPDDDLRNGDFCTFSQGGYGGNGAPFNRLSTNFATVFPLGVEVGIPGPTGFSMKFTSAAAIQAYLPAGKSANKLTADLINPTSTSSGVFGGQLLTLKLNVALSDAGVNPVGFGDLYYCNPGDSLDGKKVREILAIAENAIGGGALPAGYTYNSLSELCANLDLSFDGQNNDFPTCGVLTAWATANLSKFPCN